MARSRRIYLAREVRSRDRSEVIKVSDIEHVLRDQFETAVSRTNYGRGLEGTLRRGRALRRRRLVAYVVGTLSAIAVVTSTVGVLAASSLWDERSIAPVGEPTQREAAPSMQITDQDRAALTAEDALFGALSLPRPDGMYPYYGGNEQTPTGAWVSVFHLMRCAGFDDCDASHQSLIRVHVVLDGDVGRVEAVEGPLSPAEKDGMLRYERSYPDGSRNFEIAYSWLRDDGTDLGTAIGSYVWRGPVPTYGYEYLCTATVIAADGTVLYDGAEHPVPLGAPDEENLRSGLVGVPVELSPNADSVRVTCDDESPAPIPEHTR
jgi:hypothetical protein